MSLHTTAQDNKLENQKLPKSIRLSPQERAWFKKYAKKFNSQEAAAADLGVHRTTISDTLKMGTCGPSTYEKIIAKVNAA